MKLKFIGSEAEIGGTKVMRLGQEVDLPDDVVQQLLIGQGAATGWAGSVPLLSAERFDAIFGTDDESKKAIKKYQDPGARESAPQEFKDKLKAAYEVLEQLRQDAAKEQEKK